LYNIGVFTGIISAQGTIEVSAARGAGLRICVQGLPKEWDLVLGESIALSGVCLTVVDFQAGQATFDIGSETLAITGQDGWQAGAHVNLERALRVGDALGGHLVSGHVDGVAEVLRVLQDPVTLDRAVWLALPYPLQRYVGHKGSITLDGISLTVNACTPEGIRVNLIPHTVAQTTAQHWQAGAHVRVEVDRQVRTIVEAVESYLATNKAQ
jgi:riboflavin synthase